MGIRSTRCRAAASAFQGENRIKLGVGAGVLTLLAAFLMLAFAGSANAQIQLKLGLDDAQIRARLASQGFDQIEPTKKSITYSKFTACRNGEIHNIVAQWHGEIEISRTGRPCATLVDQQTVRQMLRKRGYDRISIEDRAGKYLAIACLKNTRNRVEVDYSGKILRERRVGECRQALEPADIAARLEEQGYDRIQFQDRQLPRYVAEACKDADRLELVMNRFGEIERSRKIGNCKTRISPDEIAKVMEEKGFDRITVTDDRLPRFKAVGCRSTDRIEVTLNRFGDMINEERIGDCPRPYTSEEIAEAMEENGYVNIQISSSAGGGFVARGCIDGRLREIQLTKYGELQDRKEIGACVSPRISELMDRLKERRFDDLRLYAEGCRRGRKIRITFDEFGNRTGREVLGGC